MALDEPKETDQVFHSNGIQMIIDRDLLEKTGPITIDYQEMGMQSGFNIQSNLQKGCAGCSC